MTDRHSNCITGLSMWEFLTNVKCQNKCMIKNCDKVDEEKAEETVKEDTKGN